jgi:hypothetical protein
MMKLLLAMAIGVAAGYQIGWKDAQTNTETIVSRTIEKVGGSNRGKYNNDIDSKLEKLEKR